MQIVKQLSILMENHPGVLSELTNVLAGGNINVVALTMSDSVDQGILRMVTDDPEKANQILSGTYDVRETDVLRVEMPNNPGSLASFSSKLGSAKINMEYIYASTGQDGKHTTVIIKVPDPKKAMEVLSRE